MRNIGSIIFLLVSVMVADPLPASLNLDTQSAHVIMLQLVTKHVANADVISLQQV